MRSKEHIYDYLAQVYFNKKEKEEKNNFLRFLLAANIIIFAGIFAFLVFSKPSKHVTPRTKSLVVNWTQMPLRFKYDLNYPKPQTAVLNLKLSDMNLRDYDVLKITLRGSQKEGFSKIIGIELRNAKKEKDTVYISDIEERWKAFEIPLKDFKYISDFSDISQISFKLEAWNTVQKKGLIYIDKIEFLKKREENENSHS